MCSEHAISEFFAAPWVCHSHVRFLGLSNDSFGYPLRDGTLNQCYGNCTRWASVHFLKIHVVVSVHAKHSAHFLKTCMVRVTRCQLRSLSLSWFRPRFSTWAPLNLCIDVDTFWAGDWYQGSVESVPWASALRSGGSPLGDRPGYGWFLDTWSYPLEGVSFLIPSLWALP